MSIHNGHAEYGLKYIIASCRLTATDCNIEAHANYPDLFMKFLCQLLVYTLFCTVYSKNCASQTYSSSSSSLKLSVVAQPKRCLEIGDIKTQTHTQETVYRKVIGLVSAIIIYKSNKKFSF